MGLLLLAPALWFPAAAPPPAEFRSRGWGVALPGLSYGPPVVGGDRIFVSVISSARHAPV
eukprot:SAG31_NODE_45758_length_257_cov_0.981013_1_plen_59_part_01